MSVAVVLLIGAMGASAQSIENMWNTGQENTIISIKKVDDKLIGVIHSSSNAKVPKGKVIVKDLVYGDGEYEGQIYSLQKQRWFDATFSPGKQLLVVKISAGWTTRTFEWKIAK